MKNSDLVRLRTGIEVSRLALGTAAFGGLYSSVSDEDCTASVQRAIESGITFFDTAPHYGKGRAEQRLGNALRSYPRGSYVLSTKIGRLLTPVEYEADDFFLDADTRVTRTFDYSPRAVRRSFEDSLTRLDLDSIDILFIHDPDDHEEQAMHQAFPELAKMREEGLIRAIGIGMNQSAMPTRFVLNTDIDMVLIAGRYSLLDQSAADDLLPAALERGVDIIAAGVFNSGVLANPEDPNARYNYMPVSDEMRAKAMRIKGVIEESGYSLTSIAMRFPLRHRAVKSVLVGCRSAAEVDENVTHFNTEIEESFWESLVSVL